MTNKEACLIIDEFERYHRGDISDEQEEAFTLASRLLSRIPDEVGVICILHGDEKMTNGEIIRKFLNGCNITDEELAKIRICPYNVSETCENDIECDDCRLKWLKEVTVNFERYNWVSCKDRLPDDQRNVLFVYHNPFYSRNEVHYGFYLPKKRDARCSLEQ